MSSKWKNRKLGFIVIFDYEKQLKLQNAHINSEGVGYCLNNEIEYLIYKDFQLYEDIESKKPIISLDITEKM